MKKLFLAACFLLLAANAVFAATDKIFKEGKPEKKYFDGEKLVYQIHYLGIPVGEAESRVSKLADYEGRAAYLLEVKVHSYRMIDWIYKVRDEHRSWIDAETLASLRYEKKIQEGRRKQEENVVFDAAAKKARYYDGAGKLLSEIDLPQSAMQDMLSCGYFSRTLDFKPESEITIPVHAQKKNWSMQVKFFGKEPIDIDGVGRFEDTVRAEPRMDFEGIFIRKGQIEGWISLDPRRIPLKMKVKIPVLGAVSAELKEYQEGH